MGLISMLPQLEPLVSIGAVMVVRAPHAYTREGGGGFHCCHSLVLELQLQERPAAAAAAATAAATTAATTTANIVVIQMQ